MTEIEATIVGEDGTTVRVVVDETDEGQTLRSVEIANTWSDTPGEHWGKP